MARNFRLTVFSPLSSHTQMVQDADPNLPLGELPMTGSHEAAGTIVSVGSQVKGLQKGDRIAATAFKDMCDQCPDCKAGDQRFCENMNIVGLSVAGAFAEYCLVDSRSSAKLPDSLSFAQAAPLTCAGATIWAGIYRCELREGQSLAIVGLGALGHIGVQLAKALRLKVVAIDARSEPLDLVKRAKHAPDLALNAKIGKDKIMSEMKEKLAIDGVDAVIDATGVTAGHKLCLEIVKKHGLFVLVGQPPEPISISYFDLIFRDIRVKGSLLATTEQFADLLEFVGKHDIKVDVREYTIDDVNRIRDDAQQSNVTGKAIVSFE